MQAPTTRPRRASPTTRHLRRHRVAMAVMRAILRCRRPRRPARAGPPKVTILLVHAWGMGGTIRTMHNIAGRLAERHEVEVVSVWRTRDDPFFAFPPGVTVTAAEDRRPGAGGPLRATAPPRPRLAALPGGPYEPADDAVDRRPAPASALARPVGRPDRHAARAQPAGLQVGPGPVLVASEHAPFRCATTRRSSARSAVATRRSMPSSCSARASARRSSRSRRARRRCTRSRTRCRRCRASGGRGSRLPPSSRSGGSAGSRATTA